MAITIEVLNHTNNEVSLRVLSDEERKLKIAGTIIGSFGERNRVTHIGNLGRGENIINFALPPLDNLAGSILHFAATIMNGDENDGYQIDNGNFQLELN